MTEHVCVHVNSRYVESNVYDLDVYDYVTLSAAVRSLAGHSNSWMEQGKPEKAEPYIQFKNRIKRHLAGG